MQVEVLDSVADDRVATRTDEVEGGDFVVVGQGHDRTTTSTLDEWEVAIPIAVAWQGEVTRDTAVSERGGQWQRSDSL